VLPGLATVWFIHRYAVNIIYADQWYDIRIIHRFHEGTLGIGDLWAQHGENRILIPNLLVLVLASTVHFNIVIEDYLSGVFLAISTGLIVSAHKRRSPSISWLYYFPLVIVLLSLNQGGMTLFGFAMSWYLVILGLSAAIFLLDRPDLSWIGLAGAVLAAVVGSYSSLEGLLIWPVGLLLIYHRMRSRRIWIIWLSSATIVTALYWYNLNVAKAAIDRGYVLAHPISAVRFFFFAIGNVAGVELPVDPSSWEYAFLLLGVVIFVIALWVLIKGMPRRGESTGSSIGVALVLFGVLYTVALTGARAGFGLPVLPRYAIFDLLILAGCYLYLLDSSIVAARQDHSSLGSRAVSTASSIGKVSIRSRIKTRCAGSLSQVEHFGVWVALIGVICVQASVGTYEALRAAGRWRTQETMIADIEVNIDRAPDAMVESQLGSGYEPAGFIRQMTSVARSQRLSLFSTSGVLVYAREGLPGSKVPPLTRVLQPATGANLRGNQWLVAYAWDSFGVTKVEFEFQTQGGPATIIGRAAQSPVGWLGGWNTSTIPNGTYTLRSVATDSSGLVTSSSGVVVTVKN